MPTTHDFWVTIGGERGDGFERHVGTRRFPVRSPMRVDVRLPIGTRRCYLLAPEAMDERELADLAAAVAQRQGGEVDDVLRAIRDEGMPILDEDCSVAVHDPQRWFS